MTLEQVILKNKQYLKQNIEGTDQFVRLLYINFYEQMRDDKYNFKNKQQYFYSNFKAIINVLKFYFVRLDDSSEYDVFIKNMQEFDITAKHFYNDDLKIFVELKFLSKKSFWNSKNRDEAQRDRQIAFLKTIYKDFRYIKIYFNYEEHIATSYYYTTKKYLKGGASCK